MAQNTTITVAPNTWTMITNADVTAAVIQNQSSTGSIWIQGTVGTTPPVSQDGSLRLPALLMMGMETDLAGLFPGLAGINRLWVYATKETKVRVSHP